MTGSGSLSSENLSPQLPKTETVVACLGSSSTAGKGQAFSWIEELKQRPENQGFRFHNFGVGGDLAYNALQRLPEVLACRPDKIVVWVGGNDVLALVSKKAGRFFRTVKHLPRDPSPEWFRENLSAIAHRLKADSPARTAFCSLPPIGEDPASSNPFQNELNRRIGEHSVIVREVAQEAEARYLAVHELMVAQIRAAPGRAYTDFRFILFYRDAFRALVLRKSPDEIARMNGWRFHTDGVHLNRRGGMIVANLVQEFIAE
jgi:lysophospholipase L1-like esterase